MLWIPPGFAHGFMVLSEGAEVLYKATDFYAPQHERTLLWNDPALEIEWPRGNRAIFSAKDLAGSTLEHAQVYEHMPVYEPVDEPAEEDGGARCRKMKLIELLPGDEVDWKSLGS